MAAEEREGDYKSEVTLGSAKLLASEEGDNSVGSCATQPETNQSGVITQNSSGKYQGQYSVQFTTNGGRERFIGRFADKLSAERALVEAMTADTAVEKAEELPLLEVEMAADDEQDEAVIESAVSEALRTLVAHVVWAVTNPPLPAIFSRPNGAQEGLVRRCRFGAACKRTDALHWAEADHPEHLRMGQPTPLPSPFRLSTMPDCRHWTLKGCCGLASSCRFHHASKKRGSMLVPNHRQRGVGSSGTWRQRGRRNSNRGSVFRRFLIDTFGFEKLKQGSGVLDVAGGGAGGGGLAFSLLNYSGIPATVVDPRPPQSRKAIDTLTFAGGVSSGIKGLSGGAGVPLKTRVRSRVNPLTAKYDTDVTPRGTPPRLPPFVPRLVEHAFEAADTLDKQSPSDTAGESVRTSKIYGGGGGGTGSSGSGESGTSAATATDLSAGDHPGAVGGSTGEELGEVCGEVAVGRLVASCSVLCGLHPDGATEPTVDWALLRGKPFAVVPCCVFWRSRAGLQEAGVRSYEDFLCHLENKRPAGEIKRSTLAFDGRNTVIWWPGPAVAATEGPFSAVGNDALNISP